MPNDRLKIIHIEKPISVLVHPGLFISVLYCHQGAKFSKVHMYNVASCYMTSYTRTRNECSVFALLARGVTPILAI